MVNQHRTLQQYMELLAGADPARVKWGQWTPQSDLKKINKKKERSVTAGEERGKPKNKNKP